MRPDWQPLSRDDLAQILRGVFTPYDVHCMAQELTQLREIPTFEIERGSLVSLPTGQSSRPSIPDVLLATFFTIVGGSIALAFLGCGISVLRWALS